MYGYEDIAGRFFDCRYLLVVMSVEAPEISGLPDSSDLFNFVLGTGVLAAAFAAFYGQLELSSVLFYVLAGGAVLATRELGVRIAANLLDGYASLEVSSPGSTVTVFGAILSVVTGLPIILLFPVYSEVSRKRYEQWGRSTDVVWAMYKFKIARLALSMLIIGFAVSTVLGFSMLAQMYALFAFFQALPFDYSGIPTGPLDGAEILRWSGFWWMFFTGVSILMITFSVV